MHNLELARARGVAVTPSAVNVSCSERTKAAATSPWRRDWPTAIRTGGDEEANAALTRALQQQPRWSKLRWRSKDQRQQAASLQVKGRRSQENEEQSGAIKGQNINCRSKSRFDPSERLEQQRQEMSRRNGAEPNKQGRVGDRQTRWMTTPNGLITYLPLQKSAVPAPPPRSSAAKPQ